MNSVTAVLLALVLIVVILFIVWLVLRPRSSDQPGGSASSARGAESDGTAVSVMDRMPGQGPVDPRGSDAATAAATPDTPDETAPTPQAQSEGDALDEEGDATREPASEEGAAAAEEFVDSGLSELDAATSDDATHGDGDGALSGTPPRTPTEAFGSADASGDAAAHEAAGRETSALDDANADSTPLFRSIREELLGAATPETEETADAFGGAPDPIAEAIGAQESTWSESMTEGVVETGAVGSAVPTEEEEELLESSEDTDVDVVEPESGGVAGEPPPALRISELHEVVDGGFGMGSAAPIADGAQPLGHPIKANVDTKIYQDLHSPWYGETEPDVWFLDPGFAERAGFRRAE